ncbi:MAG: hypothetical protein ABJA74_14175 [Lapillicoccus sp.]
MSILGQGTFGGGDIDERDNYGIHVLAKQPDNAWLIVTQVFMDARTDATYVEGAGS